MNRQTTAALFRDLTKLDNVVGVGWGQKLSRGENTGQESISVLVRKKYPQADLRRAAVIPRKIGATTTDVIEVGDVRLLDDRTGAQRPAHPGVSIGHYKVSAGTFGALVRDCDSGESLILSNNHVLANLSNGADDRAQTGDAILQPGLYDGGDLESAVIGHLKRFEPIYWEAIPPRCPIARWLEKVLNKIVNTVHPQYQVRVLRENERVNYVDCAVAVPTAASAVSADVIEVGKIEGVREPQLGMIIKKSGRSSGLTSSLILATAVTLQVGIGHNEYGVFANQLLAGPMSKPGDSGSIILSEDNYAVGLLFAGSEQATLFNPIGKVLEALNVKL